MHNAQDMDGIKMIHLSAKGQATFFFFRILPANHEIQENQMVHHKIHQSLETDPVENEPLLSERGRGMHQLAGDSVEADRR